MHLIMLLYLDLEMFQVLVFFSFPDITIPNPLHNSSKGFWCYCLFQCTLETVVQSCIRVNQLVHFIVQLVCNIAYFEKKSYFFIHIRSSTLLSILSWPSSSLLLASMFGCFIGRVFFPSVPKMCFQNKCPRYVYEMTLFQPLKGVLGWSEDFLCSSSCR